MITVRDWHLVNKIMLIPWRQIRSWCWRQWGSILASLREVARQSRWLRSLHRQGYHHAHLLHDLIDKNITCPLYMETNLLNLEVFQESAWSQVDCWSPSWMERLSRQIYICTVFKLVCVPSGFWACTRPQSRSWDSRHPARRWGGGWRCRRKPQEISARPARSAPRLLSWSWPQGRPCPYQSWRGLW